MSWSILKPFRISIVLCISVLFIAGCSGTNHDSPNSANDVEPSILNDDNIYDVIKGVIALLNEEPMNSMIAIHRNATRDEQLLTRTTLNNPYEFISPMVGGAWSTLDQYEWSCAGGGSTYVYTKWEQRGTEDRVFNDCIFDTYTISGTSGQRGTGINGAAGDYPYSEFTMTNANGDSMQLTGNYHGGSTSRVDIEVRRRWDDLHLTNVSDQGYLQVNEYNLDKFANGESGGSRGAGVNARYTVSAPWSDNNQVSVTASLSYLGKQDTSFEWQSGSIEILAADGSLILVRPAEPASNSWVVSIDEQVIDVIPATGEFWVRCSSSSVCPDQ